MSEQLRNDEIRKQFLEKREKMGANKRKKASAEICETLYNLFHAHPFYSGCVYLAYRSIRGEADIWSFCEDMMYHAVDFYFPVVQGDSLEFYRVEPDTTFVEGAFGCLEPTDRSNPLKKDASVVVLVPGIAFSKTGARLGYGRGYYDRFLSSLPNITDKVGICYESQLCSEIVPSETDVLMNAVVTEDRLYNTKG